MNDTEIALRKDPELSSNCEKSPNGHHCWHPVNERKNYWTAIVDNDSEICCWCGIRVVTHGSHRPKPEHGITRIA